MSNNPLSRNYKSLWFEDEPIYYNQEITDAFKNRELLDRIEKLERKVETMETYFFKRLVEVIEESIKK